MAAPGSSRLTDAEWRELFSLYDEVGDLRSSDRLRAIARIRNVRLREGLLSFLDDEVEAREAFGLTRQATQMASESSAGIHPDSAEFEGVLVDRYKLVECLGKGGQGVVYRALDRGTGDAVVIKCFLGRDAGSDLRARREATALRLLGLPGVARLRQFGTIPRGRYLVMDLVPGSAFPGDVGDVSWSGIATQTYSLLETLSTVHAHGIYHRDIKPENVLVDSSRRSTILDFGLARGPALGGRLTESGQALGTPMYLAPEQVTGGVIDARSDLYAVGAMVYTALSGSPPAHGDSVWEILRNKALISAPPLREVASEVPTHVASVVDELLSIRRNDRPPTAAVVLARLRGQERRAFRSAAQLQWLAVGAEVLHVLSERGSATISGPLGVGKREVLKQVAVELRNAGRRVVHVRHGLTPYEGFREVVCPDVDTSLGDFEADLEQILCEMRSAGAVFCVEGEHGLDPWTREFVNRVAPQGGFVRVRRTTGPGDVVLRPLSRPQLEPLFHGPDRIVHLREDAVSELWSRAGGVPARIDATLDAWLQRGICRWSNGAFRVTPATLRVLRGGVAVGTAPLSASVSLALDPMADQLLAWLVLGWPQTRLDQLCSASRLPRWTVEALVDGLRREGAVYVHPDGLVQPLVGSRQLARWTEGRLRAAHASIARGMPEGRVSRCRHLAAAGLDRELVAETVRCAQALVEEGQAGDALGLLEAVLDGVEPEPSSHDRLLSELAVAALSCQSVAALRRARYQLGSVTESSVHANALVELLGAAIDVREGRAAEGSERLQAVSDFGEVELDLWKCALAVLASRSLGAEFEERVLRRSGQWVEQSGSVRAHAAKLSWEATHLYRRGRYDEAARKHLDSAEATTRPVSAFVSRVNAASCFLEAGDLSEAARLANDTVTAAPHVRHPLAESTAAYVARAAAYRGGHAQEVDYELLSAVSLLGTADVEARVGLTEAAVAWRQGDETVSRRLALAAADLWSTIEFERGRVLALSLAAASGAPVDLRPVAQAIAARSLPPLILLQAGALACVAEPLNRSKFRVALDLGEVRSQFGDDHLRREVLSPSEATAYLRQA